MSERVSLRGQGSERFVARRRVRRRKVLVLVSILFFTLSIGLIWGLWQKEVRISHVQIFGADQTFAPLVIEVLRGSYLGIVPRDSAFFVPKSRIRALILGTDSGIAALSIFHSSLTSLSIKITYRTPVGRWCGLAPTRGVEEHCYMFDASGYIFTPALSTTPSINTFRLYAPLVGNTEEPLRATIVAAEDLPSTLDFARQLATFGTVAKAVVIHDGEVEITLASGTRMTYVLGDEQNAFTALVSGRTNMNLTDGSIEYVDLRFGGKIYVKRTENSSHTMKSGEAQ